MHIALWIYIAAYLALTVFGLINPEMRGTPADAVIEVVLSSIALAGMVAYAIRLNAPRMIAAWRFVAPMLLIGYVVQLIMEWPELSAREPEMSQTEHYVFLTIALCFGILFIAPSVIVNFRFARAKHLGAPAE